MSGVYVDTSALAKWYLREPRSEEFAAFVAGEDALGISRLTALEMRCLFARRRRAGDFDIRHERMALAAFMDDIAGGALRVEPLSDRHAVDAAALVDRLRKHPLRTLDALHLAAAAAMGVQRLATADRVMADAASALGFGIVGFY